MELSVVKPQAGSFNAAVHGARGLFALMVFAFHVENSGLPTFLPANGAVEHVFFGSLKFGVELFFGISGFVIIGALARAASLRSFLWDRVTRIYPLLWITLIAITAASLATGHWLPPIRDWFLNFLAPPPFFPLPQVNPAAWSLGYEITFYAICTLCSYAAAHGYRHWRWAAVLLGAVLLVLFPRAVLMPAGVLIAASALPDGRLTRLARYPGAALLAFLLLWRGIELHTPGTDIALATPVALSIGDWLIELPLLALGAMLGGLALRGIVQEHGLLPRLLRTPLFQWLGTISFSFYLWHPVLMSFGKGALRAAGLAEGPAAQLLFAITALPPSLLIAHVSQRRIEVVLTRRLRALGPRESRPHAPITAVAGDPAAEALSSSPIVRA